jgi:hypothetical protein
MKKIEEAVMMVRRTYSESGKILKVSEKSKPIAVRIFATEPAKTWASVHKTIPLEKYGEPYANVKIDVGLAMPCYAEEEPEAYKYMLETVKKRLLTEESKVRKAYRKKGI